MARILCAILQVPDFETLCVTIGCLPNVNLELQNSSVTGVTNATVTFYNWHRFQGDNSAHRVRKFRENVTAKKRREENIVKQPPPTPLKGGEQDAEFGLSNGNGKHRRPKADPKAGEMFAPGWESAVWPSPKRWAWLYNEFAPKAWAPLRALDTDRSERIRRRLKEWPEERYWVGIFERIGKLQFLTAEPGPNSMREANRNADWILQNGAKDHVANHLKILEGKFS